MRSNINILLYLYLLYISLQDGHSTEGRFHDEVRNCKVFGVLDHIKDELVPKKFETDTAELSLPGLVTLLPSSLPFYRLAIWTADYIPSRTVFGPMVGVIREQNRTHANYGLYIWKMNDVTKVLNVTDQSKSNWMRYIMTAYNGEEANLKSFEENGKIYFYTFKGIPVHTELLVWPGDTEMTSEGFYPPGTSFNPLVDETCWPFFFTCKVGNCSNKLRKCPKYDEQPIHNCPKCRSEFTNDCPVLGRMNVIANIPISANGYHEDRAEKTLPPGFVLKQSSAKGAGLGIFTEELIPSRTLLGPYDGVFLKDIMNTYHQNDYAWNLVLRKDFPVIVDAEDKSMSSWLRYINTAPADKPQNLGQVQCNDQVYYYTFRAIQPGEELFVWYGGDYDKLLKIHRPLTSSNDIYNEAKWPFFYSCPEGNCAPTTCSLRPPCLEPNATERFFRV